MSRACTVQLAVTTDLAYQDSIFVEDGDDVRFHDLAFVVRRWLANLERRGSDKVPTKSQVAAEQLRLEQANAALKPWTRTADAVNTNMILGGATTYECTFTKEGYTEAIMAPCNADGSANWETVKVLGEWKPAEPPVVEA